MTASSIRRAQVVCFALAHVPLAATAIVMAADGLQGDLPPLAATFLATLGTGIALVLYLGHALSQARAVASGSGLGVR